MKNHISSRRAGFTLVELLTVMAIIAILVGLVLGTAGYVQKAAARKRAGVEIKAFEAALESYKADNGIYPQPAGSADKALALYQGLTGDGDKALGGTNESNGLVDSTDGKSYFTPKSDQFKKVNATTFRLIDPFGQEYKYSSPGTQNTATFDLSSPGAGVNNW